VEEYCFHFKKMAHMEYYFLKSDCIRVLPTARTTFENMPVKIEDGNPIQYVSVNAVERLLVPHQFRLLYATCEKHVLTKIVDLPADIIQRTCDDVRRIARAKKEVKQEVHASVVWFFRAVGMAYLVAGIVGLVVLAKWFLNFGL
jgi:hypothetical protein